jgi:hypothetical protein
MRVTSSTARQKPIKNRWILAGLLTISVMAPIPIVIAHEGNNDPGQIHACLVGNRKIARIVGITDNCPPGETPAHWAVRGPRGLPGARGLRGPKGDPGSTRDCANPGPGQNLVQCNLAGENLSGVNLRGANLVGANLSLANLSGAKLIGANLAGANLTGATLSGSKTNLEGANLKGANLTNTDLSNAIFENANLSGATLTGSTLNGTNFTGANLFCAQFTADPTVLSSVIWHSTICPDGQVSTDINEDGIPDCEFHITAPPQCLPSGQSL